MQLSFEAETTTAALARRTERNHPLPARRRRARRLGRREGAEGRHAPGRLPGGRLARDLLRLRRLRPERPARLRRRLRQHHRTAARTAAAAGPAAGHGTEQRPLRVAQLRRPLGGKGKGLQQRADRAADEDGLAEPFAWMAEQRTTSPRLPGGSIAGPQITGAFCGAVAAVSDFINLEAKSRTAAIATIAVLAAADRALRRPHPLGPGRPRPSCGPGAPSASWSAPRASSTAATGGRWSPIALAGARDRRRRPTSSPACSPAAARRRRGRRARRRQPGARRPDRIARRGRSRWRVVAAIVIVFVRAAGRGRPAGFRASLARHAAALLARRRRPAAGHARRCSLMAITVDRHPLRDLEAGRLGLRPAGGPVHRQVASARPSAAAPSWSAAAGGTRSGSSSSSSLLSIVAGPVLTFALIFTTAAAALDQPARLADLRPADPLRRRSARRCSTSTCRRGPRPSRRSRGAPGGPGGRGSSAVVADPRRSRPPADRFPAVKLLAFSDLHRDLGQAREAGRDVGRRRRRDRRRRLRLGPRGPGGDDRARWRRSRRRPCSSPATTRPTTRCARPPPAGSAATVLHGEGTTIDGVEFFGLGAGIPVTPWDWSFDLDDEAATRDARALPRGRGAGPPLAAQGPLRQRRRRHHFGSPALLRAIEEKRPRLAVCGHIHESWGCESADRRDAGPQPRPDRHLDRGLGRGGIEQPQARRPRPRRR